MVGFLGRTPQTATDLDQEASWPMDVDVARCITYFNTAGFCALGFRVSGPFHRWLRYTLCRCVSSTTRHQSSSIHHTTTSSSPRSTLPGVFRESRSVHHKRCRLCQYRGGHRDNNTGVQDLQYVIPAPVFQHPRPCHTSTPVPDLRMLTITSEPGSA